MTAAMPDAARRRAIVQIVLLAAGFLVLVAVSTASVLLVNKARSDNALVVHTVEVENSINALLLEIRRAESAARAYLLTRWPEFLPDHEIAVANIIPDAEKLARLTSDNPVQVEAIKNCARRSRPGSINSRARWSSSSRVSPTTPPRWCARPLPATSTHTIRDLADGHARRGKPAVPGPHRQCRPDPDPRLLRHHCRIVHW